MKLSGDWRIVVRWTIGDPDGQTGEVKFERETDKYGNKDQIAAVKRRAMKWVKTQEVRYGQNFHYSLIQEVIE